MEQVSTGRRVWALWFVGLWLIGLGLVGAGLAQAAPMPEAATNSPAGDVDHAARFQQLDAEVEQILTDVVALGADMAVLNEAKELSPKTQLLVLVSIEPSAFFQLDAIQLQIDEHTAVYHQYADEELAALSQGGSHRLFWDDVPAGRHQLTAILMGHVPKDPDFQREASLSVISGVGRRVVELHIATGKSQAFPELSIEEWK
jgi:hypothetical protein